MFARSKPASQPDRNGIVQGLSPSGFHSVAYAEWGDPNATRPIVCLHGLTRQGRDFDYLAAELAALGRRVICPDLPGRGRSGRLVNPDDYSLPQYCSDMNALLARLNVSEVDWIGTSLGGLIGMVLAGVSGSFIRKLIVNDIGPYVSPTGLRRIGKYIAEMPLSFATIEDADAYFRTVLAPYGELSDIHWRHLAEHSVAWNDERQHFIVLCDPQIAKGFRYPWSYPLDLWRYWESIEAATLVLHGAKSDLLSRDLTIEMLKRNQHAEVFRFDDCGHVPPIMKLDQIDVVVKFLKE